MALTFITMCRIAGVPARWQSGLYVAPDSVGSHDWAEFYTPQTGWLNADVSFGSSARRMGEEWRRRHYFGNLDPWRMVANNRFQAEFEPSFGGMREDPMTTRWGRSRSTVVDAVSARCSVRSNSSKCSKFHFRTNR